MPTFDREDLRKAYLRSIRDPRERHIKWSRLYVVRSPLTLRQENSSAYPAREC